MEGMQGVPEMQRVHSVLKKIIKKNLVVSQAASCYFIEVQMALLSFQVILW